MLSPVGRTGHWRFPAIGLLSHCSRGYWPGVMANASVRRNAGTRWRFLAMLLAFAFALQSYVTATHIHNLAPATALAKTVGHNKAPASNDTLNCPFCQAVAHDGAFS